MSTITIDEADRDQRPPMPAATLPPATSDGPTSEPAVVADDSGAAPVDNFVALGQRLAASGDLYRSAAHASGLVLASRTPASREDYQTIKKNARRANAGRTARRPYRDCSFTF